MASDLTPPKVDPPKVSTPKTKNPNANSMFDKLLENLGLENNGGGGTA